MLRFANNVLILLILLVLPAQAHEQLLLVVADNMNASTARLQRYEHKGEGWIPIGKSIPVNLGRNGLGWGIGTQDVSHAETDPVKHEGDGRAPAGIFTLGPAFGYAERITTAMPYRRATADLVCVDDSRSDAYNRVIPVRPDLTFGSFEWMHRDDGLYAVGIVVGHNQEALPGRGSCIFLHIERARGVGTSGCTSMRRPALSGLLRWLDPQKKPLLVQVPEKSLPLLQSRFPGLGR